MRDSSFMTTTTCEYYEVHGTGHDSIWRCKAPATVTIETGIESLGTLHYCAKHATEA